MHIPFSFIICLSLILFLGVSSIGCNPEEASGPATNITESSDSADSIDTPATTPDVASTSTSDNESTEDTSSVPTPSADAETPAEVSSEATDGTKQETTAEGSEGSEDSSTQPIARQDSGETVDISFDDLRLPIRQDMVFRPFMLTDRVKELDGQRVRVSGYMLPDSRTRGIKQFVLLKNTECKFGPGGQSDHLINVLMEEGHSAQYRDDPITIEGVLSIEPFQGPDGNTWSIYDLACDNIQRYRPRRQ